jgi:fructuronate reductase
LIPCDNLAGNGPIAQGVVLEMAELLDPGLAQWVEASVGVVTTAVDRITPRAGPEDTRAVLAATGLVDTCPVITEPFREWELSGQFPAGRPAWETAGATFTADVTPYEHRKLWLLNGAHSLLAYAGSIRGYATVAEAIGDDACRLWVEQWWQEASRHLTQPSEEIGAYQAALLERFGNGRIRHLLAQIAADGSQKLPIRIGTVLRLERDAGRMPEGATRVLAAWICHLRGMGAPISDVRADEVVPLAAGPVVTAAQRVLNDLDEALGADPDVVATVVAQVRQLTLTGEHGIV